MPKDFSRTVSKLGSRIVMSIDLRPAEFTKRFPGDESGDTTSRQTPDFFGAGLNRGRHPDLGWEAGQREPQRNSSFPINLFTLKKIFLLISLVKEFLGILLPTPQGMVATSLGTGQVNLVMEEL